MLVVGGDGCGGGDDDEEQDGQTKLKRTTSICSREQENKNNNKKNQRKNKNTFECLGQKLPMYTQCKKMKIYFKQYCHFSVICKGNYAYKYICMYKG